MGKTPKTILTVVFTLGLVSISHWKALNTLNSPLYPIENKSFSNKEYWLMKYFLSEMDKKNRDTHYDTKKLENQMLILKKQFFDKGSKDLIDDIVDYLRLPAQ